MTKLTISDWTKLQVIRDGEDYAIVGPDFVNLRVSPAFWVNPGGYYYNTVAGNYSIINRGIGYLTMETIQIIIDYLNDKSSVVDAFRDELRDLYEGYDPVENPPDNERDVIVRLQGDLSVGSVAKYLGGQWHQCYPDFKFLDEWQVKRWWNMPGNKKAPYED